LECSDVEFEMVQSAAFCHFLSKIHETCVLISVTDAYTVKEL